DLGLEGTGLVEGADQLVRVDDGDIGVGLDVGGGDGTFAINLEGEHHLVAIGGGDDEHLLEVEHDVGDVFNDTVDALELVVHALDPDRDNGGAFDRAAQDATEGVADGVTVTGLEGLGDELAVGGGGAFLHLRELVGEFELTEAFGHGWEKFKSK